MRIGHGYDVHRLAAGDGVVLGGVRIPCAYALVAHSDGDVVIHAVCDALLGAAALGDIGRHFSDSDERWRDADSRVFLRHVIALLAEQQYQIANVDVTVIAEKPKLADYIPAMVDCLAEDMGIEPGQVNVKATTNEQLDALGRCEGIAVHAVALIDNQVPA